MHRQISDSGCIAKYPIPDVSPISDSGCIAKYPIPDVSPISDSGCIAKYPIPGYITEYPIVGVGHARLFATTKTKFSPGGAELEVKPER
jgi:hypothetical protein